MASENACALQNREKYYFSKQNITSLLVMFYRYQFCNYKHFLKAENSRMASTISIYIVYYKDWHRSICSVLKILFFY